MTENNNKVTLPIETSDLGSPIMGTIMTVVWGILASLLTFACISEGLARGFDRSWWVLVPSLFFWWLCYNALHSALKREYHTVSIDKVQARIRAFRAWREWSEPMGNYSSVEISTEHHNIGEGAEGGSYTATLIHSRDSYKNAHLKGWSWSRNGTVSRAEQEAAAEAYVREVTNLLHLPGTLSE